MGMGMAGVVVIDRHPIQAGPQIGFHAGHQLAHERLEVGILAGIFRRDDEAELVAVLATALQEVLAICPVGVASV